jgi:hypothetical protein
LRVEEKKNATLNNEPKHYSYPLSLYQESDTADSFYIVRRDASVHALNSIFSGGGH